MTEEQRKEMISREFLRVLAHAQGFKISETLMDHGVDLTIFPVTQRIEPSGTTRYLDSPYKLDFQLKCTTVGGIHDDFDHIRYDLDVKNFNDLVQRRPEILPLHLVVVVLSEAPPACVDIDDVKLTVIGRAFWYLPEEGVMPSDNTVSVRIRIPKANILGPDFVRSCYTNLGLPA